MTGIINDNYVIYENDTFADKYTAIHRRDLFILGFNAAPFHSQGIGQYCGEFTIHDDIENLDHLGKKINADELNDDCQKYLIQYLDESDI